MADKNIKENQWLHITGHEYKITNRFITLQGNYQLYSYYQQTENNTTCSKQAL
jgi:hypothetical protein